MTAPSRSHLPLLIAALTLAGCSQSPPAPASTSEASTSSPSASLTVAEWNDGPLTRFDEGMAALDAEWWRSSDGCRAAADIAEQARAEQAPADGELASAWSETLTGLEAMVTACFLSDYEGLEAGLATYDAGLRDTLAVIEAAN